MSDEDLSSEAYRRYRAGIAKSGRRSAGTITRQMLIGVVVVLAFPALLALFGFALKMFR